MGTGTFSELVESGIDFSALLKKDEEDEENKTENECDRINEEIKSAEKLNEITLINKNVNDHRKFQPDYLSRSLDPKLSLLQDSIKEDQDSDLDPLVDSSGTKVMAKLSQSMHSLSGRRVNSGTKKSHFLEPSRSRSHLLNPTRSIDRMAHGVGSTMSLGSLDEHIAVRYFDPTGIFENLYCS